MNDQIERRANVEAKTGGDSSASAGALQTIAERCADALFARDPCTQHLGMSLSAISPGKATLSMSVQSFMLNGHGTCHGGIIFTFADSAFAFACNSYNRLTVAAGADINFVAPAYPGDTLDATCEEVSLSGRTGVYDVRVHNQHGALIAHFRGRSYRLNKAVLDE